MKTRRALKQMSRLAERYCVRNGGKFRLEDVDPADTSGATSRSYAEKLLQKTTAILSEMQEKLYAQDRWALLLNFQGMDAAGKDSAIKHVMSGVNPQGCDVHSRRRARTSSITTFSGEPTPRARSAGGSASSIARTTRKSWWPACIRQSSRPSASPLHS